MSTSRRQPCLWPAFLRRLARGRSISVLADRPEPFGVAKAGLTPGAWPRALLVVAGTRLITAVLVTNACLCAGGEHPVDHRSGLRAVTYGELGAGRCDGAKGGERMPTKSVETDARAGDCDARAGDWIETRGVHGQAPRRGEIIEVLGREGHEHYRVRWDEQHESIVYPADGVIVTPGPGRRGRGAGKRPAR